MKTQELKKSQARLQSVFDGITDPLVDAGSGFEGDHAESRRPGLFREKNIKEVIERPCIEVLGDNGSLCPDGQIEQAVSSGAAFSI